MFGERDYRSTYKTISLETPNAITRRRIIWSKPLSGLTSVLMRSGIGGSPRARAWTLAVACMGVGLVVASMTALNTALGDLAVATSATQSQLNWIVDGYTVALACLLLPAGAIGDRYGRRGALLIGLMVFSLGSAAPAMLHSPDADHRGPGGRRDRRRLCDARDAVTADRGLSERRSHEGRRDLGRHGRFRRRPGHARFWPAASLLGLARDLLVAGHRRAGDFRLACTVASSRDADAPGSIRWARC